MSEFRKAVFERAFRTSIAYKQCFLDEHGDLTPAARTVIADLSRFASIENPTVVSPITQQTDVPATHQRIGRGDAIRQIFKRLKQSPSRMLETLETIRDD